MARTRDEQGGTGRAKLLTRVGAAATVLAGSALLLLRISLKAPPSTPPSARAVALGYEPKDANAVDMSFVLAGLMGGAAVLVGLMFLLVWIFATMGRHPERTLTPQQTAQIEPPTPHLQADPYADLAAVRAHEEGILHSYGWIGQDHTRAHIPIEHAMPLMVGRTLDPVP